MIGIKYNGEMLDLKPDSGLSFELNNLVFSTGDTSRLPGSFSFPFQMPLTPGNRRKFGFLDRIDRSVPINIGINISVVFDGLELFPGVLTVREVTAGPGGEINCDIVINPLSEVKKTPLNELDLGGDREFASVGALFADAKATTVDPLDYDYVYFPVRNRLFLDGEFNGNRWSMFQNFYNVFLDRFTADDEHPAIMPFVRLEYILERIFANEAFTFVNGFQITDELRCICLYNNRSIHTAEGIPTTINLQNHVSATAASAFVRKIMSAFCLGMFFNTWAKELRLIPLRDLIRRGARHDWTNKAVVPHTIASSAQQAEVMCWKRDEDDKLWEYYLEGRFKEPESILGSVTWADMLTSPNGIYFIVDRHAYYSKNPTRILFKYQTLGCAPKKSGKPLFEADISPLWDAFLLGQGISTVPDAKYDLIPQCRIPGSVSYMRAPVGGGDPEEVKQDNSIPDRITIYRGMAPNFDGDNYPLASGIPWDGKGNPVGEYSLRWDGEYGMYESWWRDWHNMLKNGKRVTMRLLLTVTDLINFNFEDKVRINNMDYFVVSMRVNFTQSGLAPVEATLISVI